MTFDINRYVEKKNPFSVKFKNFIKKYKFSLFLSVLFFLVASSPILLINKIENIDFNMLIICSIIILLISIAIFIFNIFLRKLKYYWKKYQHYNKIHSGNINNKKKDIIISIIPLIIFPVSIVLCKPFRFQCLNLLQSFFNFIVNILFYVIPIIAVVIFIGFAMSAYEIEKNIDNNFKNSSKINFKKGFNRLNVIIAIICTLIFMLFYGLTQYSNYYIITEYSKSINKLWEFIKHIFFFILYSALFYTVFRNLYLFLVKIIDWFIRGFKNE